jgi:hypothetical protein
VGHTKISWKTSIIEGIFYFSITIFLPIFNSLPQFYSKSQLTFRDEPEAMGIHIAFMTDEALKGFGARYGWQAAVEGNMALITISAKVASIEPQSGIRMSGLVLMLRDEWPMSRSKGPSL